MKGIRLFMSVALIALCASPAMSQFVRLEVDEINNGGIVPGKTYRVYVVMENEGDCILAVFGLDKSEQSIPLPLSIETTTVFYQHEMGGALSSAIQRSDVDYYPELAFDSWLALNRVDNYGNFVAAVPPNYTFLDEFESEGASINITDGAWYIMPDKLQSRAGKSKRILIMQLTTSGVVSGLINIQGLTKEMFDENGESLGMNVIREEGLVFKAGH